MSYTTIYDYFLLPASVPTTVCFFLSKSRSMAVIWAVYRRLLRLPAGKTSRPVQRPRCPCVAPSRRFSRISEILGAHSPPDPSAERASAPSEPKRGRKSSRWNVAISDRLDSDRGEYRRPAPYPGLGQDYGRQAGTTYYPVSLEMTSPSWR